TIAGFMHLQPVLDLLHPANSIHGGQELPYLTREHRPAYRCTSLLGGNCDRTRVRHRTADRTPHALGEDHVVRLVRPEARTRLCRRSAPTIPHVTGCAPDGVRRD